LGIGDPFGKFPNSIGDLVGNDFKEREIFWEMPNKSGDLLGAFSP
jgi:hypothetical protein